MTQTEEKVLEIWREVLKNQTVACSDVFLDLGGDSISAMLCVSRINTFFGSKFSVEDFFFDDCTVTSLSRQVDEIRGSEIPSEP